MGRWVGGRIGFFFASGGWSGSGKGERVGRKEEGLWTDDALGGDEF